MPENKRGQMVNIKSTPNEIITQKQRQNKYEFTGSKLRVSYSLIYAEKILM